MDSSGKFYSAGHAHAGGEAQGGEDMDRGYWDGLRLQDVNFHEEHSETPGFQMFHDRGDLQAPKAVGLAVRTVKKRVRGGDTVQNDAKANSTSAPAEEVNTFKMSGKCGGSKLDAECAETGTAVCSLEHGISGESQSEESALECGAEQMVVVCVFRFFSSCTHTEGNQTTLNKDEHTPHRPMLCDCKCMHFQKRTVLLRYSVKLGGHLRRMEENVKREKCERRTSRSRNMIGRISDKWNGTRNLQNMEDN